MSTKGTETPESELELYWCEHKKKCGWRGLRSSLTEKPDLRHTGCFTLHCPNCAAKSFYVRKGTQEQIDAWRKPRTIEELETHNRSLLAALKGLLGLWDANHDECACLGASDDCKNPPPCELCVARAALAAAEPAEREGEGAPKIHPDQFDANTL